MHSRDQRCRSKESKVVFGGMKASHKANQDCFGFQSKLLANAVMSVFVRPKKIAIEPVRNHHALGSSIAAAFVLFCTGKTVVDYLGWVPGQECPKPNKT